MKNKKSLLGIAIGLSIGCVLGSFSSSAEQLTNFWQSVAILILAINSIRYEKDMNEQRTH